jgi:acetamidase/formamidase
VIVAAGDPDAVGGDGETTGSAAAAPEQTNITNAQ